MTDNDNKSVKGGRREGAGRKPTGIKRVSLCISCQPEELELIKEKAKDSGKTVSSFLLDLALK